MEGIGKILLVVGGIIVVIGLLFIFSHHIPLLGKLPGDVLIKKDGFSFYFPIVTFLLLSILITIIVNVVLYFINKQSF
ncbi:MAG: DUF2905 domain-containing protein [Chloroflexota bacterium]|nr:MAG: DUF2905 domain-containing protein [Chloroflexota bacterium]